MSPIDYVVYDQYLAMLYDSPTEYWKYPAIIIFLRVIPVSFDYFDVLVVKIGEYILTVIQSGQDWFTEGMTNWGAS